MCRRTNTETDLYVFSNLSMDTLDYTGPAVNEGSKGYGSALANPCENCRASSPPPSRQGSLTSAYFVQGASWLELRAMRPSPTRRAYRTRGAFEGWPLIVITDDANAAASSMNFLWTTFTRFEPAADIHAAERRIVRNHIAYRGPVVIDARLKPGFPKELSCRDDIAQLVTRRWKEHFPGATVEMGDSGASASGLMRSKLNSQLLFPTPNAQFAPTS